MATLFGVGVGPGDPQLLTLRACDLIAQADVISYLVSESGSAQARDIAIEGFKRVRKAQQHIPITMPMSLDRAAANCAYDEGAAKIATELDSGKDVVFLCEGDPLFFGSFNYLMQRLSPAHRVSVVPGVSSVHAAAAALKLPLTMQSESFAAISGRHSDAQILQALRSHDSLVIMKAGVARARILALLEEAGRLDDAQYLEHISRVDQRIERDVRMLDTVRGPYFSLFVVTRSQTRQSG
ncbi:MAG: precorrin-2 C(20)-methyltransferase [Pseudomonadales bacterium]